MTAVRTCTAVCVYILASIDILINTSCDLYSQSVLSRLSVYSLQDLCLILSFIVFVIQFFRKEILQTGNLLPLIRSNSHTIAVIIVYSSLTLVLQTLTVTRMNSDPAVLTVEPYFWKNDPIVLFVFFSHRLTSAVYYFSFQSSITQMYDPVVSRVSDKSTPQTGEAA